VKDKQRVVVVGRSVVRNVGTTESAAPNKCHKAGAGASAVEAFARKPTAAIPARRRHHRSVTLSNKTASVVTAEVVAG